MTTHNTERQYREKYATFGEETRQLGIPPALIQVLRTKRDRRQAELDNTAQGFWALRKDDAWAEIPSKKVYSRKFRANVVIVLVNEILIQLQPATTFNPMNIWNDEKRREEDLANAHIVDVPAGGGKPQKKAEVFKAANSERRDTKAATSEITKIRNNKENLVELVRQLSSPRAREILLLEILKKAMTEPVNVVEVFDVLWAIDQLTLTPANAPQPDSLKDIIRGNRDPSLVYDSFAEVEKLLRDARHLRSQETDIVRFQLNEMSDRLPPLSVYSFGFKLDAWQKRALLYIDAGKSVILCAPTSSGKTVLSTYVALIGAKRLGGGSSSSEKTKKLTTTTPTATENPDGEEVLDDEDEEDSDEDDDMDEIGTSLTSTSLGGRRPAVSRCLPDLERLRFRRMYGDGTQRVLFVVPTEPLVWQVAAYFTKLLREEGGSANSVAIVTNQMTFHSVRKLGVMPQIVVGTPLALESALTKPRGLVGSYETTGKSYGTLLAGGFEHFDWAIYDEVHALDGEEGDALQRIIRAMNCKFLSLSATVGNAEELRGWMERAKGDHLMGTENITVMPEEASCFGSREVPVVESTVRPGKEAGKAAKKGERHVAYPVNVRVSRPLDGHSFRLDMALTHSVGDLRQNIWRALPPTERDLSASRICINFDGQRLVDDTVYFHALLATTLDLVELQKKNMEISFSVELPTSHVQVTRSLDSEAVIARHLSPTSTLLCLKRRIAAAWPIFNAQGWQLRRITAAPTAVTGLVEHAVAKGSVSLTADFPAGTVLAPGTLILVGSAEPAGPKEVVSLSSAPVTTVTSAVEGKVTITLLTSQFAMNHASGVSFTLVSATDLIDNGATLESCQLVDVANLAGVALVHTLTLVNLLSHQGRFINLQRFVWSQGKLLPINPLAAVESVESLRNGILSNSSLSFTSKDSYRLWLELEKLFPPHAVSALDPHSFFPVGRITLQQTKDYEDKLKEGLRDLARTFPVETQELLFKFRLEEPKKEVDFCDLALKLKEEDKLPCLGFHRNAFEAIHLFQQLVAGMEFRQKRDHPTYYADLESEKQKAKGAQAATLKSMGGNSKETLEAEKSGDLDTAGDFTVDPFEPHPKFRFCKTSVMTLAEYSHLSDEMEKFDGFPKRDPTAMRDNFGQNEEVMSHALMRGLRRGIGLYINEVSSPAYRRAVQRLASQGKLAVVISDDSLAFGVNMPFRTCLFCGEMEGTLTPLMAQQMSGRAGRRGLDTQGNLVYVGSRPSFIRDLMIGSVANITGADFPPRYDTIFLQGLLSPRHVGWSRLETLVGRTLNEFVMGEVTNPLANVQASKQALADLGLIIEQSDGSYQPRAQREVLTMVWQLREHVNESVCLGRLLPELFSEIANKLQENRVRQQKEGNARNDKTTFGLIVNPVFSMLLQIVDRVPHDPNSDLPPLHEHAHFSVDRAAERELFLRWMETVRDDQDSIPANLQHLRLPVAYGTPLDSTFFSCILDKFFVYSLTDHQKQSMKSRMWHVGNTLQIMWNSLWPCNEFYEILGCLHTCFRHLWYLNTELVRSQITFDDISSCSLESKGDIHVAPRSLPQAALWSDNASADTQFTASVPFTAAAVRIAARMGEWKLAHPTAPAGKVSEHLSFLCSLFQCLKEPTAAQLALIRLGFEATGKADLPRVVSRFSSSPEEMMGSLLWVCVSLVPAWTAHIPALLNALIDFEEQDILESSHVIAWAKSSHSETSLVLPAGCTLNVTELEAIKSSKNMVTFIEWLVASEEEDDEEEEEEDDA